MSTGFIGKITNPIGAFAPNFDPVGKIGKSIGGPVGQIVDPSQRKTALGQ